MFFDRRPESSDSLEPMDREPAGTGRRKPARGPRPITGRRILSCRMPGQRRQGEGGRRQPPGQRQPPEQVREISARVAFAASAVRGAGLGGGRRRPRGRVAAQVVPQQRRLCRPRGTHPPSPGRRKRRRTRTRTRTRPCTGAAPAPAADGAVSDAALFKLGQEQYQKGQYEEATETLSKIDLTKLPDDQRTAAIQVIAQAKDAADQRTLARKELIDAEKARQSRPDRRRRRPLQGGGGQPVRQPGHPRQGQRPARGAPGHPGPGPGGRRRGSPRGAPAGAPAAAPTTSPATPDAPAGPAPLVLTPATLPSAARAAGHGRGQGLRRRPGGGG